MKKRDEKDTRRKFLKNSIALGAAALTTGSGAVLAHKNAAESEAGGATQKVKVLTTEGKVIEIDKPIDNCKISPCESPIGDQARQGIPGRSFVMVIDLARCKNARK